MKSIIKNILIVVLLIVLSIVSYYTYTNKKIDTNLEIDYIDVGQGNAVLVKENKKVLLIDGGGRSSSRKYYSYIDNKNIDTIDYLLVSHYDEDHIAGLISILDNKRVINVICPNYKKNSKIYKSFMKSLKNSSAHIIHPQVGDEFILGKAKFKILWPKSFEDSLDNENSIVLRLSHGNNSFLFPQDVDTKIEDQLIYSGYNLKSDVLMLGHHGSKFSTSKEFIKEVRPKLAILSVGKNNRYNHPAKRVIDLLINENIKLLRTDIDGNISLESNGNEIKVYTDKE
ncbi:MBL fold metallo-hydrolase [Anaerococcus sp. AGMB00486]|uniref:MBL fold metallo-hydrolase n=1 Tax=Anaerococcus faecalis TaxID=2742993 RepID=A0ABX2N7A1_9FIRM|nr:ComEC/Rec2 family competence protein [Anaerococcus faecalis]NVF10567.1 MBL fold metallo-hydrolase [Anaerococcus faecalis]